MKRLIMALTVSLIAVAGIHGGKMSYAQQGRRYEIMITNTTRGQIISSPVVVSHSKDFDLFTLGAPASPELVALAEDGLTDPITDHLATLASVHDYVVASGPLMPGASVTLEVTVQGRFRFISAAGMLVTTNDAFFAIRGVEVPRRRELVIDAEAYDAGSEENSESCDFIPGPPCGNGGVRDTDGAEGYVHIHAGIQGIGDLTPSMHDWRNPVVELTIRAIR